MLSLTYHLNYKLSKLSNQQFFDPLRPIVFQVASLELQIRQMSDTILFSSPQDP